MASFSKRDLDQPEPSRAVQPLGGDKPLLDFKI